MKTLRQAYKDALASGAARITYCMRIVREDGQVFRFTDHDEPLNMGGATYFPDRSGVGATAVTHTGDLQTNELDLEGALTPNGIDRESIIAGRWDFARVYLFRTLWDDPVEDDEALVTGWMGKTEIKDNRYTISFVSLKQRLQQQIGRTHMPTCDADLGDSRCKVKLDPPEWTANTSFTERPDGDAGKGSTVKPTTANGAYFKCIDAGTSGSSEPSWNTTPGQTTTDGTVTWEAIQAREQPDIVAAVNSETSIDGGLSFPSDFFGAGLITFTSGENNGISREVDSYTAPTYTLWDAFPFPVEVGDTFIAQAGCRKRRDEDCVGKFNNVQNHRGFPDLPGPDVANRFGGQ